MPDQRRSDQSNDALDLNARSGLLQVYLHDITQVPLLTPAQETALGDAIREGQEARQELDRGQVSHEERRELWQRVQAGRHAECRMVEANLRLVVSIANRYAQSTIPYVDLIQEGNLGLLKAVQRFDSRLSYRFSTYATYWIRQTMGRMVAEGSRTIRLPSHVAETMSRLRTVTAALTQSLGRRPNLDELTLASTLLSTQESKAVQDHLDKGCAIPAKLERRWQRAREQVRTVLELMAEPISLETPISDENETMMEEIVPGQEDGPDETAIYHILTDSMAQALDTLSDREQHILRARYGLGGNEPRTLEHIGQELGVTRERVRQIEKKALTKLRQGGRARALRMFLAS